MKDMWNRAKLRLVYLGIGLTLGLLIAAIVGVSYNEVIEIKEQEYEAKMAYFEKLSAQSAKMAAELKEENKNLKTKTIERVNADGSKELITETDSASSSKDQSLQYEVSMLEHSLSSLREEHKRELEYIEKTRPSFSLMLGIDTNMTKSVHVSYAAFSPIMLGGWATQRGEFGVGIGYQF